MKRKSTGALLSDSDWEEDEEDSRPTQVQVQIQTAAHQTKPTKAPPAKHPQGA